MGTFNIRNQAHFMQQIQIDTKHGCWLPRRLHDTDRGKARDRKTTITHNHENTTWRRLAYFFHFGNLPTAYLQTSKTCISQNCCNPLHAIPCRHPSKACSDEDFLTALSKALTPIEENDPDNPPDIT